MTVSTPPECSRKDEAQCEPAPLTGDGLSCLCSAKTDTVVTHCAISSYEIVLRLLSKNTGVVGKRNAPATQAPIF